MKAETNYFGSLDSFLSCFSEQGSWPRYFCSVGDNLLVFFLTQSLMVVMKAASSVAFCAALAELAAAAFFASLSTILLPGIPV